MKVISILKRSLIGLLVAPVILGAGAGKAAAAQIPYDTSGPTLPSIPNAVFNTYTNVPNGVGDESDFVRIRESNGNSIDHGNNGSRNLLYISTLNAVCNVGDMFDVRTYIHNGADADYNDNGNGTAVADNTKLAMTAPLGTNGKAFTFSSTITSDDTQPISDSGTLNCEKDVRLELVPSTLKVYNETQDWMDFSTGAVNGSMSLGSRNMASGKVWGCWDETIQVVYTVKVVAIPTPPTPAYSCDLLTFTGKTDNKYNFKVNYTAVNGAVLKDITYAFSDGKTVTSGDTVSYQYTDNAEKRSVKATANFTVGSEVKSHTDVKCGTEFTESKPPVVVKPAATLPKTGAGSVLGIFGAVSAIGAFLHRSFVLRRN